MAARKTKEDKSPVKKSKPKKVLQKMYVLDTRKKVLLILLVLAAAYVIFFAKGLFIAATVNGRPVSRLSVVKELEKQGGKQVLDSLINEALITGEARKQNIVVSQEDLDARVGQYTDQVEAQGQKIDDLLAAQGMTKEDFENQIKIQLYVEKLLEGQIEVTDDEVNSFIETNKDFLPEGMSGDELKDFAKGELRQQKLSGEFSTWIEGIKQSADINYFVEY